MKLGFALGVMSLACVASACGDEKQQVQPVDAGQSDSGLDATIDAGHDAGPLGANWSYEEPPATRVSGDLTIDRFFVDGPAADPNPVTGAVTPTELNGVWVTRYRASHAVDTDSIFVGMPGFLGGAKSFDILATAMVERGLQNDQHIEFWAIDRRANGLEDLSGMDVAEAEQNPEAANGYYFKEDTVNGQPFAGFKDPEEVSFMSEWGIPVHVGDLRAVIDMIPSEVGPGGTFLLGHSFGSPMSEIFASWEFEDGVRGAELIAGLVFLDGVVTRSALTEEEYLTGVESSDIIAPPGLTEIRASNPYSVLPILGVSIFARAEVMALRAWMDPDGFVDDSGRDGVLRLLLNLSRMPEATNEAILGFAFDDHSNFLSFVCSSMGEGTGGELEEYMSLLGTTQVHPSDPDATYTWLSATEVDPPEWTDIDSYARSWTEGQSNFTEWYFPTRLLLDVAAVGRSVIQKGDWQFVDYELRAIHGASIDVPILAIPTEILEPADLENLRGRIAPIRDGLPQAGATRDSENAFKVVHIPSMTHLDPVTGANRKDNQVITELLGFAAMHSANAIQPK